jgi:excinuclease ABC subunit A
MVETGIVIRGAREHNLRDVSLVLPRGKLICLTGVSGSGKSSLAFDTLYAEGQRRYVESLSSYARQFLGQMPKPRVDRIDGLSPSISIQQKTGGRNPRSTVGTITEINDYLRVLYARVGQGHCPNCGLPVAAQTREQIVARVVNELPDGAPFLVLSPVIRGQKGEYKDLFIDLARAGFVRARVNGQVVNLTDDLGLDRQIKHSIEVVIDRLKAVSQPSPSQRARLAEAIEQALARGEGSVIIAAEGRPDWLLSSHFACPACGIGFDPPSPQLFSFNSPQGMCLACDGLGIREDFDPALLVPDDSLSVWDGAIAPLGPVKGLGRWRRHIFEGVAANIEADPGGPPKGTMLKSPWKKLDDKTRHVWLYGTGDRMIVFRWKTRHKYWSHQEKWPGVANELLAKYRGASGGPIRAQLEPLMRSGICPECSGSRLNPRARAVTVGGKTLVEVGSMPIGQARRFFDVLAGHPEPQPEPPTAVEPEPAPKAARRSPKKAAVVAAAPIDAEPSRNGVPAVVLDPVSRMIADELLKEIRARLTFLTDVGLDYLALDRAAPTLSGGEAQRIRLASQVGAGLVGVLYILDEPSIGLHPRDNDRLLATLRRLAELGNTVIVVEHDEDTMRAADHLVDFGPGPGVKGGEVVAHGTIDDLARAKLSLTGQYLSGQKSIPIPAERKQPDGRSLTIRGARHNNLRNVDAEFPLGLFVCVTGVSGSGKSSLVGDILREALARDLNGASTQPGEYDRIEGLEYLDKVIDIDQSPIGRTPRSNPATYIKLFDLVRDLYTQVPEAKARGYLPGRFSFNVSGGRCEACEGNGSNRLEMDFLADVWVTCPVCEGKRFGRETLHVRFKGKSISDVLDMDVQEALEHFGNVPKLKGMLKTLHDVGLDYIKLGQASPTLSGGEAQRIKLARELVKRGTGKTLYILDEPTTGLHFEDVRKLLEVLHGFTALGNTVVVIEHNLDVIKTADWIIDMGPEGGSGGGKIIASGPPEAIAQVEMSHTGQALRKLLGPRTAARSRPAPRPKAKKQRALSAPIGMAAIEVRGARQHNLKGIDLDIPRNKMTVCSGPSGSGKSSLAIDTLYAEGQRRYVESLSSYARQFLAPLQKPRVERISGLSPAICIEQKTTSKSPRSTVGTVTEIHDYLRILFARLGHPHCPKCGTAIGTQTADEIVEQVLHLPEGTKIFVMAPYERRDGESYEELWDELRASGYARVRVDSKSVSLDDPPKLSHRRKHKVEVLIDRAVVRRATRSRLADSIGAALDLGKGVVHIARVGDDASEERWPVDRYSQHRVCDKCNRSFDELVPHHFSFNSPLGWCPVCQGLGIQQGANPALLVPNGRLSLREGAVAVWPAFDSNPQFASMIAAMGEAEGIDLDMPFDDLDGRARRVILHGAGDTWYTVPGRTALPPAAVRAGGKKNASHSRPADASSPFVTGFSFQYKGLFPAIEEAGRVSFVFRYKLQGMVDEVPCVGCMGARLRDDAAAVRFKGFTLDQISRWPLGQTLEFFKKLGLGGDEQHIAGDLVREIHDRLSFLVDVGLDYLSLARGTPTLSGGESQRIRLASQIGSGLTGVLYVLDEPTIGLHPRDNKRLLGALEHLRDLGNTLVLVEHDREVIEAADHLLDFGPGSGDGGGRITAAGSPRAVTKSELSLTGAYLSGRTAIPVPTDRRPAGPDSPCKAIVVKGARQHNLRNLDVRFPVGVVTAVTGVSGSGKSSLVEDILWKAAAKLLHRAQMTPGAHEAIEGLQHVNKVISVDQSPLGNTPSSTPATYAGAFDLIRELFGKLPESKVRGYSARRFSFNQAGGRCEACEGAGQKRIEMHFLPDVWITCDACGGKRYTAETLDVKFHGKTIADVLAMSVSAALELFENVPRIRKILQTLEDVGLGYIPLGQSAPTLSGGEAQRVKLAAELARPDTGQTLYILDEPTTGLHFDDIKKLLNVIHRLADLGNTVIVIEHNLDVIKTADWVIDLGPEAGMAGGAIVGEGTPEDIVRNPKSLTGRFLEPVIAAGPPGERPRFTSKANEPKLAKGRGDSQRSEPDRPGAKPSKGNAAPAEAMAPWEIDGRSWHTRDRVAANGRPIRWEGRILETIVDRVEALAASAPEGARLSATDWSQRNIVRINGPSSSKAPVPFLHATTSSEWVVHLRFFVPAKTFRLQPLEKQLGLVPFHESPTPVLCDQPRVKIEDLGPFEGIVIVGHAAADFESAGFDVFLKKAVAAYLAAAARSSSQRTRD